MRGVPDLAADADQQGGSPVVLTSGGKTWITSAGGTSGSAPLWGTHGAGRPGRPSRPRLRPRPLPHRPQLQLPLGVLGHYDRQQHSGHATSGRHGQLPGGPGWDPVTGWGSPDAQVLVPLLARLTSPSTRQQDHAAAQVRAKLASTSNHAPEPVRVGTRRRRSRASLLDGPHHPRRTSAWPGARTGRYGRSNPRGRHSALPLLFVLFGDLRTQTQKSLFI